MKIIPLTLALAIVAFPTWAENRSITLDIPGMSCAACPITIKKALSRVEGVQDVAVSYKARSATVQFDDELISAEALAQITADVGYPATIRAPE